MSTKEIDLSGQIINEAIKFKFAVAKRNREMLLQSRMVDDQVDAILALPSNNPANDGKINEHRKKERLIKRLYRKLRNRGWFIKMLSFMRRIKAKLDKIPVIRGIIRVALKVIRRLLGGR
jgi:hypothetical protein